MLEYFIKHINLNIWRVNKYKKIHIHCKLQSFVVEVKKISVVPLVEKKNNFLGRNTVAWGSKAQQMIWFTRWMRFGDFILNLKVQLVQIKKKFLLWPHLSIAKEETFTKRTQIEVDTQFSMMTWEKTYFCRWLNFSLISLILPSAVVGGKILFFLNKLLIFPTCFSFFFEILQQFMTKNQNKRFLWVIYRLMQN